MAGKDRLINNLHKIIRDDPYVNELCKSNGIEIDSLEATLQDIYNQYFFNSMTWMADILAKQMGISLNINLTQEEKNSLIEARWKNNGKSDIDLLQNIANSWKNGDTEITFKDGKIQIKFVGEYGTPTDLNSLKSEIDKAKPCHLIVEYLFKYLLIKDIHEIITISELETMTLDKFAF